MDGAGKSHVSFLVYCDESGLHGAARYGFGSLWIPVERRGDLTALIDRLREKHRYRDEIKWTHIKQGNIAFYRELMTEFFKCKWMMFHALIVRRGYVDKRHHEGPQPYDIARRKHFAMLIKNKVRRFSRGRSDRKYHVRIDRFPSSYAKADEAAEIIVKRALIRETGLSSLDTLRTRDSKMSVGIQLADMFIGALMSAWNGDVPANSPKRAAHRHLAEHLGWPDLLADTQLDEWKFNIWYFHDPTSRQKRECQSRPVRLLCPMPPLRQ